MKKLLEDYLLAKTMRKYFQVMKNTFEEYLVYRVNFLMWRVRNILGLLTGYFLIKAIFTEGRVIYGYDLEKILTYIFTVSILRAIIFASRTVDLAGVINSGDLTNYLTKPISTLKVWFTRDIADKALNIGFCLTEVGLIIYFLKPPFFIQTNPVKILAFIASAFLAILLYFLINFLIGLIGFWTPEVWAPRFIFTILLDFFSGGVIPLDVLPSPVYKLFQLTPFPYLLFNPINIWLGRASLLGAFASLAIVVFWIGIFYLIVQLVWQKGLRIYSAEGR